MRFGAQDLFEIARRRRLGSVIGLGLFAASLPLYVSHSQRPVLERWSYEFAALMLVANALWLGVLLTAVLRSRGRESTTGAAPFVDGAILLWGAAYLANALVDRVHAGRAADLNLFGSTVPAVAALEWFALLLFVGAGIAVAARLSGTSRKLAFLLLSIASLAVLGEGAARARALIWPATQGFPTYSSEIWNRRYGGENSFGFRDVEHAPRPEPGVRRLLVVGDSYTYGTGIEEMADRFDALLGRHLERETSESWEAINAGTRDTHTLDHIAAVERMATLGPDIVVLLYVFNDIEYLKRSPRTGLAEAPRTVWARFRPGRLLFLNSYLFQELFVRWRLVRYRLRTPTRDRDHDASDASPDLGLYGDAEVLSRHLADLSAFVEAAGAGGSTVVIVPFDVATATSETMRLRYERFVSAARERGLPVCSLANAFDDHDSGPLTVNRLDGHPNEEANALAADAAAECVVGAWRAAG